MARRLQQWRGSLTVTRTVVSDNVAESYGGGIFSYGTVAVTDSTFEGNTVDFFGGGDLQRRNGDVSNTRFKSNSAAYVRRWCHRNSGGSGDTDQFGVRRQLQRRLRRWRRIYSFGTLTLDSSSFKDNVASYVAGAIYNAGPATVTNSTLASNSATFTAGAIYNAPGVTLTLGGTTLAGNTATSGGGLDNAGTLIASAITVRDNESQGGQGGGGLLNEAGGSLTLDQVRRLRQPGDCGRKQRRLRRRAAERGDATITSCTFPGNQAVGGSGLDFFGGSAGGAIDNFGGATLDVTGSTFRANQAVGAADDASGSYFGMGGAVENNAGFNDDSPSTASFTSCVFVDNESTTGTGGTANGGAIDNQGGGATMTLTDCTLTGNQAGVAPKVSRVRPSAVPSSTCWAA